MFRTPVILTRFHYRTWISNEYLEKRLFTYCMHRNMTPMERERWRAGIRNIFATVGDVMRDDRNRIEMHTSVITAWTQKMLACRLTRYLPFK
jgi:hypothetical protein